MKKLIHKNQKGFTLIEMLIVMIIVGILVVLVIPNASDVVSKANSTGCDALKTSLEADALATKVSTGSFPSSLDPDAQSRIEKVCTGQTGNIDSNTGKVTLSPKSN